ncbi:MAG: peptide ABC transporter permease, partial [Pollutimonas bauzanensis]
MRRLVRHRLALFGVAVILFLVLACSIGPLLLPFDDTTVDILARFSGPLSGAHVLGTDQLGRDMLARLLMAGRISLAVGFGSMILSMII